MPNNVLLPGVTRKPTRPSMKINHSKKKITKKKNNTLNQIINYLKSNPYMYSHFISPRLPSPPPEMNPSVSDAMYAAATQEKYRKKKLVERVRDYMKSDDYLYKPLLDTPCFRRPASAGLINHSPPQGVERQQKHSTDVSSPPPMGLKETIWRKNKEQLSKKTSNHHVQSDDHHRDPFNSSSSTSVEEEEYNNMENSSILHPRTPAPHHEVVTTRVLRRRTVSLVADI